MCKTIYIIFFTFFMGERCEGRCGRERGRVPGKKSIKEKGLGNRSRIIFDYFCG